MTVISLFNYPSQGHSTLAYRTEKLNYANFQLKLCGWEQELAFNNGLVTSLNKYHKDKGYLDEQKDKNPLSKI